MSVLGDAIRSNADLHRAVYRIVSELAAYHLSHGGLGLGLDLQYLGRLAASALPHIPPPVSEVDLPGAAGF